MARQRSVLAVPGGSTRMIEKGLASAADLVFLDLEDAVTPDAKPAARAEVIRALRDADWQGRPRTVRVNAVDSPWFAREVVDLLEGAGDRLDRIIVPKVGRGEDLVAVSILLGSLEQGVGRQRPVDLEAQVETAAGLTRVEEIVRAGNRLVALVFGPGDFAASAGIPSASIGGFDESDAAYPGHRWHYPMSRIQVAAAAAGIPAIDGPYANFRDVDGLRRSARTSRAIGYAGKWCIHPAQVELVNELFTPTEGEIAHAREVLAALEVAGAGGAGAVALGSQMLDRASIRMAYRTLQDAGLEP